MKSRNKQKESKVTLKTHHKHHPIHKDEMKEVRGGMISSYQPTRPLSRREKEHE